eukprot:m.171584 g.171584  ORF g.171584 m.171584 type:complete len:83 (-) comp13391_c0_seq1:136-384(-)
MGDKSLARPGQGAPQQASGADSTSMWGRAVATYYGEDPESLVYRQLALSACFFLGAVYLIRAEAAETAKVALQPPTTMMHPA